MRFKSTFNFEERKIESERVLQKYPDRVPIIVEKIEKSELESLEKNKFLVPDDLTICQLIFVIRKRIKNIPSTKSIFLFVKKNIPCSSMIISELYSKYKDDDGFLYVEYSEENTFG